MYINWLFVSIVLFFAICIIGGYKKGFLKLALSFAGLIAVIYFSTKLYPAVSDYLNTDTAVYEKIRIRIAEKINEKCVDEEDIVVDRIFDKLNLPKILMKNVPKDGVTSIYENVVDSVVENYISGYLAKVFVNGISYLAVFLILYLLFKLLLKATGIVDMIPIVNGFNRLLGGLIGALEGLLAVWIAFFLVLLFFGNEMTDTFLLQIKESRFLSLIFNTNIFLGSVFNR